MRRFAALIAALLMLLPCSASAQSKRQLRSWFSPMCVEIKEVIASHSTMSGKLTVDKVAVRGKKLHIYFSRYISDRTLSSDDLLEINDIISRRMPEKYRSYRNSFKAYSCGTPLEELVGRYGSGLGAEDEQRQVLRAPAPQPLVRNISSPVEAPLSGRHIALWQSHGRYYNQAEGLWKWQRPRLFTTCEDLFTQSYVLPFLVPMIENAGAVVMLPRERDIQWRELIVDGDGPQSDGSYAETDGKYAWETLPGKGFAHTREIYTDGQNPFEEGSVRGVESCGDSRDASTAVWIPAIEAAGEYAVYVSYATTARSTAGARYRVSHNGGDTDFLVNQTMGGGTWIYLGTFGFTPGVPGQGVTLTSDTGRSGEIVSADAVRFGGGMGNISRRPTERDADGKMRTFENEPVTGTSGMPRWCEGSRLYLQWAGMADTLYSTTAFRDDYYDDYKSRPLWVNALLGGSQRAAGLPGYRIPVDLSFALHSDAGITPGDSVVGTLAIYTKTSDDSDFYPGGGPRTVGREFADIVQSQVVSDIRATLEPDWSRRSIWDKSYYESRVPYVPAMLLEMLSHQNLADMQLGLDPVFKFTVSRAVYKGMLRFIGYLAGEDYAVAPLPPSSMALEVSGGAARLTWKPTADPLEPSATADSYMVYTRILPLDEAGQYGGDPEAGLDGFDNGTPVTGESFEMTLEPGYVYSFKVASVGSGGRSLCGETLSAGIVKDGGEADAIVVNNFDRLAPPAWFADSTGGAALPCAGLELPDTSAVRTVYAGFNTALDCGVAYMRDISYAGAQYEFRRYSAPLTPEEATFGSSGGEWEDKVIAGNTFDYPLKHGAALMKAGHGFASASRSAVAGGDVDLARYAVCDLVCGKQVRTPRSGGKFAYNIFPEGLQTALRSFKGSGGTLIVSGAYIATDSRELIYSAAPSEATLQEMERERQFTEDVLKITRVCPRASSEGTLRGISGGLEGRHWCFFNIPNIYSYCVESPDGIAPAGGAQSIMEYDDTGIGAAVLYEGDDYRCYTFAFPLETLSRQSSLDALIEAILAR